MVIVLSDDKVVGVFARVKGNFGITPMKVEKTQLGVTLAPTGKRWAKLPQGAVIFGETSPEWAAHVGRIFAYETDHNLAFPTRYTIRSTQIQRPPQKRLRKEFPKTVKREAGEFDAPPARKSVSSQRELAAVDERRLKFVWNFIEKGGIPPSAQLCALRWSVTASKANHLIAGYVARYNRTHTTKIAAPKVGGNSSAVAQRKLVLDSAGWVDAWKATL